jgi:hypothetical protein
MKESRCRNSGALLFHPTPEDLETISIKEENKALKERLEKLEILVKGLIDV